MIGFNGGLIGAARDITLYPSKPGIWSTAEQVNTQRVGNWLGFGAWQIQQFSSASTSAAVNGSIPNGSNPFWVDILPTNADLDYDAGTQGIIEAFDGNLDTNVYWTGNQYPGAGNVTRATRSLGFTPSLETIRIYGTNNGSVSYTVQLLDSSKTPISGTSRDIDQAAPGWHSVTVAGSAAFLEFSCTSGNGRRLRLAAIEVNGKILVNKT